MEQKIYSLTLRFKGGQLHWLPLEDVTAKELQLIAFIHGSESVSELRYVGMKKVVDRTTEDGETVFVESEMDEYKRLARKYDTIVNSGRGRKAVEECFRTRLDDFDAMVAQIDPVDAMEKAAAEAEAKAALASVKAREEKKATATDAVATSAGRVFGGSGSS